MTAIEQYLIDTYRACERGTPLPPPPGRDDVAALRAARSYEQCQAVLEGHPANHPWRAGVRRLLSRPGRREG
ncbi:hypothetical protein [Streptomyces bambusae]|uniref:Uncharacterized protein n=1 Tax=Streptomyces bambusae TaxID=1550616 RepID=A0ABS6ZB67_9ACTN|nr:hypothetical protein [Streptomyces bambusae]MBW5484967.1 hypothetical protein [Streptomyces bambusae]